LIGKRPIEAISEVARDIASAMVVMGAISRSGLKRVFIGNTAERILDAIGCDVLVVKAPDFARRLGSTRHGARLHMTR
jgi:universal stress protein E